MTTRSQDWTVAQKVRSQDCLHFDVSSLQTEPYRLNNGQKDRLNNNHASALCKADQSQEWVEVRTPGLKTEPLLSRPVSRLCVFPPHSLKTVRCSTAQSQDCVQKWHIQSWNRAVIELIVTPWVQFWDWMLFGDFRSQDWVSLYFAHLQSHDWSGLKTARNRFYVLYDSSCFRIVSL